MRGTCQLTLESVTDLERISRRKARYTYETGTKGGSCDIRFHRSSTSDGRG